MKFSWAWLCIVVVLVSSSLGTWYVTARSTRRSQAELFMVQGEQAVAQRRWADAATELQAALELEPHSLRARLSLADVQFRLGRLDDALATAARVPSRSSSGAKARLLEGTVLLKAGRASQAEAALQECLRLDPSSIEARRRLVFLYGVELRRADLRRVLWELHELGAAELTNLVLLSGSTFIGWNAAEGTSIIESFVASDGGDVSARVALARYRMKQNDIEGARNSLLDACRMAPEDIEPHIALAESLVECGEMSELAQLLSRFSSAWLTDARSTYCRGRVAEASERTEQAIDFFRETVRIDPDHHEANYRLGQLLLQSGDDSAAQAFLDRARKLAKRETLLSTLTSNLDAAKYAPMMARLERELGHDRLARAWYAAAARQSPLDEALQAEVAAFGERSSDDAAASRGADRSRDGRSP